MANRQELGRPQQAATAVSREPVLRLLCAGGIHPRRVMPAVARQGRAGRRRAHRRPGEAGAGRSQLVAPLQPHTRVGRREAIAVARPKASGQAPARSQGRSP
jgi:hypothetical protein